MSDPCTKSDHQSSLIPSSEQLNVRTNLVVAQLEMLVLALVALAIFLNLGIQLKQVVQNELNIGGNVSAVQTYSHGHQTIWVSADQGGKMWLCSGKFSIEYQSCKIWADSATREARYSEDTDIPSSPILKLAISPAFAAIFSSPQTTLISITSENSASQQFPRLC
ncbi:MAG TPA: hypothetical protein VKJ65_05170 [Phycisphaerae bacterium]|nr:hypothetical protein [Phycisphaerae bacterium]